jgi:hypothetical protein
MVHFFNSLLPTNLVKVPSLISAQQLSVASLAIEEAKPMLTDAPLTEGLTICQHIEFASAKKVIPLFQDCIASYRAELVKPNVKDPFHRLQLHQAIMAAGFYERAANSLVLHGEGTRFVLNHYNFDVRRDVEITRFMRANILEKADEALKPNVEQVFADLLQLERRLFGPNRLVPVRAKQWLVCGVPLTDVKSEKELHRLLELPVVKTYGNFKFSEVDEGPKVLFKMGYVEACEEQIASFQTARDLGAAIKPSDLKFALKISKPVTPLTRWERIRERLLRYWVIWLSFWISFWFVDEEVITLISMIYMKVKTTKIQKALAEEAGEETFYVARAKPRMVRD